MVAALVRFAVKRSLNDTRHVRVVKRRHATGLVLEVYRQVERDFKMLAPPTAPSHAPELIGTAVAFHYYNRVVNVFLRESPFPSHVPESAKPKARKVLGGVLRPAEDGPPPGDSVALLPAAPLPDDLSWA